MHLCASNTLMFFTYNSQAVNGASNNWIVFFVWSQRDPLMNTNGTV